jgi:hypothetical protein
MEIEGNLPRAVHSLMQPWLARVYPSDTVGITIKAKLQNDPDGLT